MSKTRMLIALSVGVFGLAEVTVMGQSSAGGGLSGGPPGARSHRQKVARHRAQYSSVFGPRETYRFGDPIDDLTAEQLRRFGTGRMLFEEVRSAADGLGPTYNARSCAACHSTPVSGGSGSDTVLHIGRILLDGTFDAMASEGGPVYQSRGISDGCVEVLSSRVEVVAPRVTSALFGAGLIEAIPDEAILALEDPDDADGDGISGRAHLVDDPYEGVVRVGRFGWKAQIATLETFSAESSLNHLGITTRLFVEDNDPNGAAAPSLVDCDAVPDPEDAPDAAGVSDFERIAEFLRMLAPPPQRQQQNALGLGLFQRIGCNACHTPVQFARSADVDALSNRAVMLYSDLLLHDMGASGDGIVQGDADENEMRTAPLWGLGARPRLWHDGRFGDVTRIRDAIEAHEGEAAASRDLWLALPESSKRALLVFLGSI